MNNKINIINASGLRMQADIICMFDNLQTGRRFVYYTLNEISGTAPNNTVKIYVSKVRQGDQTIDTPITDQEWSELKGIMSEILKGAVNNSIRYVPYVAGSEIISISDKQIAMPISYEYITKHQAVYNSNVDVMSAPQQSPAPTISEPAAPVVEQSITTESTQQPIVNAPIEPVVSNPDASAQVSAPAPVAEEQTIQQPSATPVVEVQPIVEEIPSQPIAPVESAVINPAPVIEPSVPKIELPVTPEVVEPVNDNINIPNVEQISNQFVPINVQEIDEKYDKIIRDFTEHFNSLREREKEAALSINSQNELMMMQRAQHAEYVKNEQEKEVQMMGDVVNPMPVIEEQPSVMTEPAVAPVQASSTIEPTPVTPVQPVIPQDSSYLETNWFDVQNN